MNLFSVLKNIYKTTQPKPWKPEKPIVIQFPVNDICNSRCQMCNIWQQKFDYQISPPELAQALSNPLFSEVRAVGVNGGEPTLRRDIAELVDTLFKNLPKLKSIALITNSLNSKQVIERIVEIGQVVKSHAGSLDVMVSLDGVGDVHDRVRGRKGNFENAVKVIDFIQASDLVHGRRLGCTVIKENIYGLHDLLEFALNKDIYVKYRLGIPHQRLYSKDVTDPFVLTLAEKYHLAVFLGNLIIFYEKSEQQQFFYKSLIDQIMYQKPRAAGCDWQYRGATLSARGELLYCAVESKTLGSAIAQDSERLYIDNQEHLADIVRTKCNSCLHDYVGLPSTEVLLKSYRKRVLKKLGFSSKSMQKSKLLEPLKLLKQQLDFRRRLISSGVNFATLAQHQPAVRFAKSCNGKRKVLICGWYGSETLGDQAILGGIVRSLQDALGDFELHLASLEVYVSQVTALQMPELRGFIHSVADALTLASSMDLVVFGGGPLMAIAQMAEMLAIFQKAVEAQVPTLIAGCGVGPLGASYHNQAVKWLLQHASYRIYRDEKSLQVARSLGIDTSNDLVAEDPAFTWLEACASEPVSPLAAHSKSQEFPILLLGLRDWPYEQYAKELDALEAEELKLRFEKEVLSGLERLIVQYPNLKIIPFPMCTNHMGGDDRWFYRRLFRGHTTLQKSLDLSYLGAQVNPLDAVKVFKSASAALTMRFHSLVFVLASNVPSVSVDYTLGRGKVNSLAEKYHVPQMSLDSITSEFIYSSLSALLDMEQHKSIPFWKRETLIFRKAVRSLISRLDQ